MKKIIISILLISSVLHVVYSQTVFYVNSNATLSGNGTSWAKAFKSIQEGINAASNSLTNPTTETAQVWVQQGTYYVYINSTENTISIKEGVEIYGGFAGNENNIDERDITTNTTIIDGHQSAGSANQVKHVVTAYGVETTTNVWESWTNGKLDGFTITGGKIEMQSPPSKNKKRATDPQNNVPKAQIKNCEISENYAMMRGGGISIDLCEPILENCKIIANTCDAKGGGVYIDWVCPQVVFINCLLAENNASRAGAVGADGSSSPLFINCTITNNTSIDVGAGIYTGSYNADGTDSNEPVLINCIVSGNSAEWGGQVDLRIWHDDYFYVSHSLLGAGLTSFGDGVSYDNPDFEDIAKGNYALVEGSAGIDAGVKNDALLPEAYNIPTTDINGNTRDNTPDMGCYEHTAATDTEPPVPDVNPLPVVVAECAADVSANKPTATDNTAGVVTATTSNALTYNQQGTFTITWDYDDGNGNITNQKQVVKIEDKTNPVITCPSDITLDAGSNNKYVVSGTELDFVSANDNCMLETTQNDLNNLASLNGYELPEGKTTITWTATDKRGNTATCSFDVTVNQFTAIRQSKVRAIKVYPNPTNGIFTIEGSFENAQLIIRDITGCEMVNKQLTSNTQTIDISGQPAGSYILNIKTSKIKWQKMITIE